MQHRIIPFILALLLCLSSCSTISTDESVADAQGTAVYESIMTGVAAAPQDDSYNDYETPCSAYVQVLQPNSFADAKAQIEKVLKQTPVSLGINVSKLSYSDKINLFNYVAETYCAIYNNQQPEFTLPYWTTSVARWNAAQWKLNYADLQSYNEAGCPEIKMTRLNYTQGWVFENGGGGGAYEEYCDKYLTACNDMTDYQKAMYILDLVSDQVNYDYDAYYSGSSYRLNLASNAENYFTSQEMCCWGYSRIYQALCLHVGLQCYEIVGTGNGGCHAWNAVVVDGKMLIVDPCWYDGGSAMTYCVGWGTLASHTADTRYAGVLNYST